MVVMEYKCPCCGAGLAFGEQEQMLRCSSCGNTFEIDAVKAFNEPKPSQGVQWDNQEKQGMSQEEAETLRHITCPSCGGEIIADANTAATFCPYCDSPAVLSQRVDQELRPDGVIPFKVTKEEAKAAFAKLCKGKPLLPKNFASEQRIEKIAGIYVPFWLYDCDCTVGARYRGVRVKRWSDPRYHYVRTDHFLLLRAGRINFDGIPVDGSTKMDNAIMESIEPYDYSQLVDFDTAYLSGFLADKYDVPPEEGHGRIEQRMADTADFLLRDSCVGYQSVTKDSINLSADHARERYVLLPVWMLYSKYQDKTYVFAMNGQTGRMTGTFPIDKGRRMAWFAGVSSAVFAVLTVLQFLL